MVTEPDGATVEVATVGCEGIVGLPLFVESEAVTIEAFNHVGGKALRMSRSVLRSEVNRYWLEWFPDAEDRPARHITVQDLAGGMLVQLQLVAVAE